MSLVTRTGILYTRSCVNPHFRQSAGFRSGFRNVRRPQMWRDKVRCFPLKKLEAELSHESGEQVRCLAATQTSCHSMRRVTGSI